MSIFCLVPVSTIPRIKLNNNLIVGIFDWFLLSIHSVFTQHLLWDGNPPGPRNHRCDQWTESIRKSWGDRSGTWKHVSKRLHTVLPQSLGDCSLEETPRLSSQERIFALWVLIDTLSKEREFPFVYCLLKTVLGKTRHGCWIPWNSFSVLRI